MRISGLGPTALLQLAPAIWPVLTVAGADGSDYDLDWAQHRVQQPLGEGMSLVVGGDDGTYSVVYRGSAPLPDDHIVHPYLSYPAAMVNRWEGREAFHAGAVVIGGVAWAICGWAGTGKTTTMAGLVHQGLPMVTDDLLIVGDGGQVFAGPRCMDLRKATADFLGVGDPLGVVGSRERWRLTSPPVAPVWQLGGWIYLEWGGGPVLEPIPAADRLAMVFRQDAVALGPVRPTVYLDLAALPAWVLRRPADLGNLHSVCDLLIQGMSQAADRR